MVNHPSLLRVVFVFAAVFAAGVSLIAFGLYLWRTLPLLNIIFGYLGVESGYLLLNYLFRDFYKRNL